MSVFFTSDLHIGHKKISALRFGYQDVPDFWTDYETGRHDAILAEKWDTAIKPEDIVWVLGDISSGSKTAQLNALEWIGDRPGIKHLIAGNHDSVHPMHRDSHKWLPIYLDGAFETVQMAAKRRIPLPHGHLSAMLSHLPYEADHTVETRYPEWRLRNCGYTLLHGHTHTSAKISFHQNVLQIHVGVDGWDFTPVPIEKINEIVAASRPLGNEI